MKRWVISIQSLEAVKSSDSFDEVVLGLLSARLNGRQVKSYIEFLISILRANLDEQCSTTSYVKASTKRMVRVHSYACVSYVDHPYVFRGQLSEIISIRNSAGATWMQWKGVLNLR